MGMPEGLQTLRVDEPHLSTKPWRYCRRFKSKRRLPVARIDVGGKPTGLAMQPRARVLDFARGLVHCWDACIRRHRDCVFPQAACLLLRPAFSDLDPTLVLVQFETRLVAKAVLGTAVEWPAFGHSRRRGDLVDTSVSMHDPQACSAFPASDSARRAHVAFRTVRSPRSLPIRRGAASSFSIASSMPAKESRGICSATCSPGCDSLERSGFGYLHFDLPHQHFRAVRRSCIRLASATGLESARLVVMCWTGPPSAFNPAKCQSCSTLSPNFAGHRQQRWSL